MNCSLILEEVIGESDQKEPLYIAFLDVKAAFDVVSHASLLRKLFHIGVEGTEWSLINSLHTGAVSGEMSWSHSHASLLRKLFHIGVEGTEWSLINSQHTGVVSGEMSWSHF